LGTCTSIDPPARELLMITKGKHKAAHTPVVDSPTPSERAPDNGGLLALSGWKKWLLLWAIWTGLGLFEAARLYFEVSSGAARNTWIETVTWGLSDLYLWFAFSFLVIRITNHVGFGGRRWPLKLAVHLVAAVTISLVQIFLDLVVFYFFDWLAFHELANYSVTFWQVYKSFLQQMLHTAVFIYFLIAFVSYAISYYKQYRDEELRLATIETRLAQAELQALKMQLHPHFLFNTLNSITALIYNNPEAADRMTTHLSDLLRKALDKENVQQVSLREELDFLGRYLEIQQIRFADRLQVTRDIAPETLEAQVPNLILQPLVENAVEHGITSRPERGEIRLSSRRDNSTLVLTVADNGPGVAGDDQMYESGGRGLANTRERLRQLYGAGHNFGIHNRPDGGLLVKISIPFTDAIKDEPAE